MDAARWSLGRRSRRMRAVLALFVVTAAALGASPVAHAGTYRVYSCKLPGGGRAPLGDSAFGWQQTRRGSTQYLSFSDDCPSAFGLSLDNSQPSGAGGAWVFVPPTDTTLAAYDFTWNGTAAAGGEATVARSDQSDPTYVARHSGDFPSEHIAGVGDLSSLTALVACSFANPCSPSGTPVASFRIAGSVMTIRDLTPPTASAVTGEFATSPTLTGAPMTAAFSSQDKGSGVYRLRFRVDDQDQRVIALGDNGGRCLDVAPADADPFEFAWPVPCPLAASNEVKIDTTGIAPGPHQVTLVLDDAAGNGAVIYGPVTKTVVPAFDRGPLNGSGATETARFAGRGRRIRHTTLSHSRTRVSGTLFNESGAPVGGAVLDILVQVRRGGAPFRNLGTVTTDAAGRFRAAVPAGPSRRIRIGYRSHVNDTSYAAFLDVLQRVRASATLRASRHRIGPGGRVTFRGRVRGGYVSRRGKLVELQAFDRGRWRTVTVLRTNSRGRFRFRYRFTRTVRPTTYPFRVRVRYEPSYPFTLGYSRRTTVTVS